MKYIGNFVNMNDENCRVEFITHSDGSDKEITLLRNPVIIKYEGDDDIFKPIKMSGATIKIWANEYLMDLYSSNILDVKCLIYKEYNLIWRGYVTPQLYSQDYFENKFELEIECIDCLSILKYFDYKPETHEMKNFNDIIKICLDNIGYEYTITAKLDRKSVV